jgi:hypothetical protein
MRIILFILVIFLVSCEETVTPKFKREVSVGCLISPYYKQQQLIVCYTTDVTDTAINWTNVFVYNGMAFLQNGTRRGSFQISQDHYGQPFFTLSSDSINILAGETYTLQVETDAGSITGSTKVPESFKISAPIMDKTYKRGEDIDIAWSKSINAEVYIINLRGPGFYIDRKTGEISTTIRTILNNYSFDEHFCIKGYGFPGDPGKYTIIVMACDENFKRHKLDGIHISGIEGGYGYFSSGVVDTLNFLITE